MNSFNHYAYGSVAEWSYRDITGLKLCEEEPGYGRFRICPKQGKKLDMAEFTYESMHGRIVSGWKREGDTVEYHMTIPGNTKAEVRLKGSELVKNQAPCRKLDGEYICELGSGDYVFAVRE